MADRLSAEIWIGGDIPAHLVPGLCEVIRMEGVALDWGALSFQPNTVGDLLALVPNDETLRLCDERAAGGSFEQLEKFLQDHRIAFKRRCEGRYEHEPQLVEYRPGCGLVELDTNAGGYPVVLALDLVPVKHLLEAALELAEGRPDSRLLSLVQTALKLLREQLPPELPPLEPFRVVPNGGSDTGDSDAEDSNTDGSQPVSATPFPKWLTEVDWEMLRRQKEWLAAQASAHPDQAEGLLSLLDALQDWAIDDLGLPEDEVLPGIRPRTNQERAERAERALKAYGTVGTSERDDALTDLLTDLRHYCCHQRGMDWDGALEIAAMHFKEECGETDTQQRRFSVANHYCEFSAVLPNLPEDEEAWLREQLTKIYVFGDREYTEDELPDALPDDLCPDDADWQGLRVFRDVDDGETEHNANFNYDFQDDEAGECGNGWGRHLWFFAEESGSPDNVAWLVRKFLARFRPRESWELSYAFTCSKLSVDAFGGGTLFVTAEAIHCTEDYLTQLRDQFRTQQSEAAA